MHRQPSIAFKMLFLLTGLLGIGACGGVPATPNAPPVPSAQPAPSTFTGDTRVHDPGMIRQGDTYRLVHHVYDAFDLGIPKLQIHDLMWTDDGWPEVHGAP